MNSGYYHSKPYLHAHINAASLHLPLGIDIDQLSTTITNNGPFLWSFDSLY